MVHSKSFVDLRRVGGGPPVSHHRPGVPRSSFVCGRDVRNPRTPSPHNIKKRGTRQRPHASITPSLHHFCSLSTAHCPLARAPIPRIWGPGFTTPASNQAPARPDPEYLRIRCFSQPKNTSESDALDSRSPPYSSPVGIHRSLPQRIGLKESTGPQSRT